MTAAAATQSQGVLEQRAQALLTEWGDWQRREPFPLHRSRHPIFRAMTDLGEDWRSPERKRELRMLGRRRRLVEVNGKTAPEIPMSPDRADKGSRGGAKVTQRWPEHVERVDRVLAATPAPVRNALISVYMYGLSTREGASHWRVSHHEFRRRVERGVWFLIGRLNEVDGKD